MRVRGRTMPRRGEPRHATMCADMRTAGKGRLLAAKYSFANDTLCDHKGSRETLVAL